MRYEVEMTIESSPVLGGLAAGVASRLEPRLMRLEPGRESRADYERAGGYAAGGRGGEALPLAVEAAGLRGRGGAAFPFAAKLRAVADRPGPRCVVANGEEGEPASAKDRWLLRARPHLVIDGLRRTAAALGAERAFVFVSDRAAAQSVALALRELDDRGVAIELRETSPGYVAGEETSVVRAINGGPALPTTKPPRPFEAGVAERPTLVANVETLANIPWIATSGPRAFRAVGTRRSPGTFLFTVSGACREPGLYEMPLGIRLEEAIQRSAGFDGEVTGFLMGGFFAGLLGPRGLDCGLDYDELDERGSGLGCGAVVVLGADDCPVSVTAAVVDYLARKNARQCGACIRGTASMAEVLRHLVEGGAGSAEVARLRRWAVSLPGRGACGLLDGAAGSVGSLFREFPDRVDAHLKGRCDLCLAAAGLPAERRFGLEIDGAGAEPARVR